jgi:CHRD domain
MREKLLAGTVAALALGVAGCGGSGSTSATAASRKAPAQAGPILIYRASLAGSTGTPAGAPAGAGEAVVALHGSTVLCWRFAHLHGFTNATGARIQLGSDGHSAHLLTPLSTGPRLHHRGCLTVTPGSAKAIERRPSAYYVAIDSTGYPAGAVRGRL